MNDFLDFAQALQVAIKASLLYRHDHPLSVEAVAHLTRVSDSLFSSHERLNLAVSANGLLIDRRRLEKGTQHTVAFVKQLSERNVNGLVLHRGLDAADLEALVRIFSMKPQRVAEQGGVAQMLGDAQITRIRVSHVRYEEIRDGEEVVDTFALEDLASRASASDADAKPVDRETLLREIFRPMLDAIRTAIPAVPSRTAPGVSTWFPLLTDYQGQTLRVSDPRHAPEVDVVAIQKQLDSTNAFEEEDFARALAETIQEFDPEMQSRLLNSRAALPPDAPLRTVLDELAPTFVTNIVAALTEKGVAGSEEFTDIVKHLYKQLPPRDRSLERLKARLDTLGIDHDQLEELMEVLSWETLDLDAKVHWLGEGRRLYEVPPERLLTFLRDLLIQKRHDDFVTLTERYGMALQSDSADLRRTVLENFVRIAQWSRDPGFLPAEETIIQRVLFTHFLREPDSQIQQRSCDALSSFIGTWMLTGKHDKALRSVKMLEAGMSAASEATPWKRQAYEQLIGQLSREYVRTMCEQLYSRDVDSVATDIHPFLAALGAPAAAKLIEQLGVEDDRSKRGRLIRAVKAIGRPALIPLSHSLSSPTWYLVRNTLNLLGDLAAVELVDEVGATLRHPDPRVQRAAARALSKIGGERSEALLIDAISRSDGEMLTEVLFSLGALRAEAAVIPIGELTRGRRIGSNDPAMRERAIEALAQIGSPRALPILEDLLKKRTLLGGNETPEIRLAAARALVAINTPEAKVALRRAVENESSSMAKEQMTRLLES